MPRLTVAMAATLQGFPSDWTVVGRKTAAYRQVGNAFPPPVARAVGEAIAAAIAAALQETEAASAVGDLLAASHDDLLCEIGHFRTSVMRHKSERQS